MIRIIDFKVLIILSLSTSSVIGNTSASGAERANDLEQVIDAKGGLFMQEESPAPQPVKRNGARINVINQNGNASSGQKIDDNLGGTFMEETTETTAETTEGMPRSNERVPIDISRLGVQINSDGNIVPLIRSGAPPVQEQYNSGMQAYQEMPVPTIMPTARNPLGLPYNIDGQPAPVNTTFIPVAPGTIPGIRSMNLAPGYYSQAYSPFGLPTIGISPYGYPGGYPYVSPFAGNFLYGNFSSFGNVHMPLLMPKSP